MPKKIVKVGTIISSIVIVVIMGMIIIYNMGIQLNVGNNIIDEYRAFYFYKADLPYYFGYPGIYPRNYKIWCLPQQKQKLSDALIEDTNKELTNLAEEYDDIMKEFEVSDDFKKVYIFLYKDSSRLNHYESFRVTLNEKVVSRIKLYNQISNGYKSKIKDVIDFVEPSE